MASTSELDRVSMVVLRYMRKPFFALVLVYAVGIIGMALIPGRDADGNAEYMSLFHAFYFFTYTATTTGFGEIPSAFTDEQRLWAILCLYMGVIAWLYAIGSTIRLLQNPHFLQAVSEHRFARTVRHISEPFFIICGFGDTGSLLARGLSDHYLGAVIVDSDPERIKALALRDYRVKMPGLCADASVPKHLVDAGVKHPCCEAVVILNNDEDINLKIAVMTKFLNPSVRVICRSTSARHQEHLNALGGVTIINPFEIFAQLLSMAITNPRLHNLNSWLVRAHGFELGNPLQVPGGDWILCGYGRMGRWFHKYMVDQGINSVIIDPDAAEKDESEHVIHGYAGRETLKEAGIEDVVGIVAGTDHDSDNLSILMSARRLNPDVFVIVRQNNHENQLAFDAACADLTLQSSLTTARRILKFLISPLIQTLIDYLRDQEPEQTDQLIERLRTAVGGHTPHLWRVNLCEKETGAATEFLNPGKALCLGDLLKDPNRREGFLSCVPLMLQRDNDSMMLPPDTEHVRPGDEILFCGTEQSERLLLATLNNPYTLHYVVTGADVPRAYFFSWLTRMIDKTKPSVAPV
ncbi:MAG: NAD-binding protein [Gammaproteobacteria bacterium]|nr:NAD-binding protein [Gammaproteobacteria bacterium]